MRFSSDQLERLSERVFRVLKESNYLSLDITIDKDVEDKVKESINRVLEEDNKTEDRLSREAERLVDQQKQIAIHSNKSKDELVAEVRQRLAKAKRLILDEGPERCDHLAEKMVKAIWKVGDAVDFYAEDQKIQNVLARALYRFRLEDDRLLEKLEELTTRKVAQKFSQPWCQQFDRLYADYKSKLAAATASKGSNQPGVSTQTP